MRHLRPLLLAVFLAITPTAGVAQVSPLAPPSLETDRGVTVQPPFTELSPVRLATTEIAREPDGPFLDKEAIRRASVRTWAEPAPPRMAGKRADWWLVGALVLYTAGSIADFKETRDADRRGAVYEVNVLFRDSVTHRPVMARVALWKVAGGLAGLAAYHWRPREARIGLAAGGLAGIGAAVHNNRQNRP